MYRLAYVSTASGEMTSVDLQDILESAITNNSATDVTGILLFNGINFLQVLEGPQDKVESTFSSISADERHTGVVVIYREKTVAREFENDPMLLHSVAATACEPPAGMSVTEDVDLYLPSTIAPHLRQILQSFDTITR